MEDLDDNRLCIRINDADKYITGLTKQTTCDDVIYALLRHTKDKNENYPMDTNVDNDYMNIDIDIDSYSIYERWRGVERQLSGRTKILKVWRAWGKERNYVRLYVKQRKTSSSSSKRHHHHHHRHHRNSPRTTSSSSNGGSRYRHNQLFDCTISKILQREKTLQEQAQRLSQLDQQIDKYETRFHMKRMRENGNNYLQNSYWRSSSSSSADDHTYINAQTIFPKLKKTDLNAYEHMCNNLLTLQENINAELHKLDKLTVIDDLQRSLHNNHVQNQQLQRLDTELINTDIEIEEKRGLIRRLQIQLYDRINSTPIKLIDNDSDTGLSSLNSDADSGASLNTVKSKLSVPTPVLETLV